jgi:hypothetical protein
MHVHSVEAGQRWLPGIGAGPAALDRPPRSRPSIAPETYEAKNDLIASLSAKYRYEPWRVRTIDLQRAALALPRPPRHLLSNGAQPYFFATLVLQSRSFVFTTSEVSSAGEGAGRLHTPYSATMAGVENGADLLSIAYDRLPVAEFPTVQLVEIMGKPSLHYFPFKEAEAGRPLQAYLVVNPYESCAYRCRPCSRLPFLTRVSRTYQENIARIVREVRASVETPAAVKFINIITGSTASAEGDLELYRAVTSAFDRAGFEHCEYGVYTANIQTQVHMEQLRKMRVVFFTVTVETTTSEARQKLHGPWNPKGQMAFDEVVQVIQRAGQVFPYVNTTLILGYDPADKLKWNLERLARETRATVNHYVPRIWVKRQLDLLHPAARNLEYYVDLSAFIERNVNAPKQTVASFFEARFGIPPFKRRYRS